MSVELASLESNVKPPPYEPKRNNRFIVTFPEEFGLVNYVVKSINRPSCHIMSPDVVWDMIPIIFYDPIAPSTSQSLMESIKNKNIFKTITIILEMVDPTNTVVEKWNIEGEFIYFNFGELDYSDDGIVTIHADFSVVNAELIF